MNNIFLGLSVTEWADLGYSLLIIVIAVLVGRWLVALLLDRAIRRLVKRTKTRLDDSLLNILRSPLYLLLVVFASQIAVNRLGFLPESWDSVKDDIFFVLYLFVGYVFVWQFVT
ncbi:MAG: hypothetical protein PVG14_01260, partial [Anaerolineales bacterium]